MDSVASVLSQLWLGSGVGSTTYRQLEKVLFYRESGLTPNQAHQTFHPSNYGLTDDDLTVILKIIYLIIHLKHCFTSNRDNYYDLNFRLL